MEAGVAAPELTASRTQNRCVEGKEIKIFFFSSFFNNKKKILVVLDRNTKLKLSNKIIFLLK